MWSCGLGWGMLCKKGEYGLARGDRCSLSLTLATFPALRHRCGWWDTQRALSLIHYQFNLWLTFTSGTWSVMITLLALCAFSTASRLAAPPPQSLSSSYTPSFRRTISFFSRDKVPGEFSPFPIGHCPSSCHSVPDSKIISKLNLPRGTWVVASASCSNNSLWLV